MATLKDKLNALPKLTGKSDDSIQLAERRREQWIRLMRVDLRHAQDALKAGSLSEQAYKNGLTKISKALDTADADFWHAETRKKATSTPIGSLVAGTAGFKYLGIFVEE